MNRANEVAMGGWSLRVGRLFGVDIRLHWFFLLWLAWSFLALGDPAFALLLNGVLFGSVFLHEMGHCLGARLVGGTAHEVLLHPLGGFSRLQTPRRPRAELVSVGAGPFVNLVLGGGALGLILAGGLLRGLPEDVSSLGEALGHLLRAGQEASPLALLVWLVVGINTALFLFNILPAFPMDGGRILRALLWPLLGWRRATLGATGVGVLMGGAFVLWGVHAWDVFLVLIGGYVAFASGAELRRAWRAKGPRFGDDDLVPFERGGRVRDTGEAMPFEGRSPHRSADDDEGELMPHERGRR